MPTAEWRRNNPEKQKALAKIANARRWAKVKDDPDVKAKNCIKTREWYAKNRDRALLQKKEHGARPEVRHRRRNNAHIKLYGITLEQREALFAAQGFKCAVCKTGEPGRRWELDHCHATGNVRGVLCSGCNLLLGHGQDNPKTLKSAAEYLERGGFENVARIIKR